MDLSNPNHWSGVLTVGSPLRGAQIATSTRNGVAQNFIANGTRELLRGPQAGSVVASLVGSITCLASGLTFGLIPCIPLNLLIQTFGTLGTVYSSEIAALIVREINNSLNLTDATAGDLNPNGGYMQNLIGQSTGTPKIQIWGREDNPIFWRLAGTFARQGDDEGVNLSNTAAGAYQSLANAEFAISWVPPFIFRHGFYNHRGHQWMAGANWIRDTSNDAWPNVIGAGFFQTVTVYVQEYDYNCGMTASLCGNDPNNPSGSDEHCFSWVYRDIQVYYPDQSDGVVPAYSQRNDGGAWRGYILEAPGVNHMEILDVNEIRPTFDFVFNQGDAGIDQVFRIGP